MIIFMVLISEINLSGTVVFMTRVSDNCKEGTTDTWFVDMYVLIHYQKFYFLTTMGNIKDLGMVFDIMFTPITFSTLSLFFCGTTRTDC